MGSERICVSRARTEFYNLLSLLSFGCYLAVTATGVLRTWVLSFGEALLVLTREAELVGHDIWNALAGSNWSSMSGRLRD